MNAVSLFSGIGGIDIGLSAAGFDVIAQVEIDEYCQQVLRKHRRQWWPNAVIHDDARQFGADSIGFRAVDILAGGFPCQPFSTAGVQRGADDHRNMWPETRRIIGEIQPRVVLLENVAGLITRTGDTPAYVGTVLADLSQMGYVGAWGVISAADAGAPHRRERIWIVAYRDEYGRRRASTEQDASAYKKRHVSTRERRRSIIHASQPGRQHVGNTTKRRSSESPTPARGERARVWRKGQSGSTDMARSGTRKTQSRMGRAAHGVPRWLDRPEYPAPQGIYQHAWEAPRTVDQSQQYRRQRIQALGNAVIPQIVYYIAKEIYQTLEDNS